MYVVAVICIFPLVFLCLLEVSKLHPSSIQLLQIKDQDQILPLVEENKGKETLETLYLANIILDPENSVIFRRCTARVDLCAPQKIGTYQLFHFAQPWVKLVQFVIF